jgi:hypothetical protein
LLETQSYVQRNGNVYEYLTNEEQEIEKEIKSIDLDSSEISAVKLFKYLSSDDPQDEQAQVRQERAGLPVRLQARRHRPRKAARAERSTSSPQRPTTPTKKSACTAHGQGRAARLPWPDRRLLADLRLLLKTEKYTKQRTTSGALPSTLAILQAKQVLNAEREKELIERLRQAVGKVHPGHQRRGDHLQLSGCRHARERWLPRAGQPHLHEPQACSAGRSTGAAGRRRWPERQGLFTAGSLSALFARHRDGVLGHLADQPWRAGHRQEDRGPIRVQALRVGPRLHRGRARLVGRQRQGRAHDRCATPSRTEAAAASATPRHQHTVVAPAEGLRRNARSPASRQVLHRLLRRGRSAKRPASELARFGKDKLAAKHDELNALVTSSRYPFVAQLSDVVTLLDQVAGKPVDWYLNDFDLADD